VPTRLSVFGVPISETAIQRRRVLPIALLLIGGLATLEWYSRLDFSLGVLYTIPVAIASAALNRWQIVLFGCFAALARAPFTPAASEVEAFLKFAMASIAYTGTGLLLVEMSNNRRRLLDAYAKLQTEQTLRRRAQDQLRTLAESSPAAILTLDRHTVVLAANRAAEEMLAVDPGSLVGSRVDQNFPMFANALKVATAHRTIRTSASGWARRQNDQQFPVHAWFSVYGDGDGRCLAAIVVDESEEVRDREREHFQHLLDYNRLLASSVSHEIRNLCSAIAVVCSNLRQRMDLRGNADFEALQRLVDGLMSLASIDLKATADEREREADLRAVLDQLRVVIEPDWDEVGGRVTWQIPDPLPQVAANGHGLLQIFLNLCQNSLRAVEGRAAPALTVSAAVLTGDVVVTVTDNGPGVTDRDGLFQLHPARSRSEGSGLGLYISRELARSVGGDLQYVPTDRGAQFRVIVPIAVRRAEAGRRHAS
jgi:signal transduction histidine kinase